MLQVVLTLRALDSGERTSEIATHVEQRSDTSAEPTTTPDEPVFVTRAGGSMGGDPAVHQDGAASTGVADAPDLRLQSFGSITNKRRRDR